jgi:hypothetical protein
MINGMPLELIGPHPFARAADGTQAVRIGTLFTEAGVLFTQPPGVHAWQRLGFIEHSNRLRAEQGLPPLNPAEEERVSANSVDLIFDADHLLIRPDPQRMDLAFIADEFLQTIVSKRLIKFLTVSDKLVREAIKHRGESWRLSSIPKTREAKQRVVYGSKVGIHGATIYFYNRLTGTRWLTCEAFSELAKQDDNSLATHLQEIAEHAVRRNRKGRPEIDFFAADLRRFGAREFGGCVFEQLSPADLRAKYQELCDHFRSAVHEAFRKDDCHNKAWCERMLSTLFLEGDEAQTEQILSGLSPEFFMQVEWMPGGRFEEGEFLFDPVFDEAALNPQDTELQRLCDPRAKGIILNLIRDFGDLEYVNVGCVPESLSLDRPQRQGRRGVFLIEFRSARATEPIQRLLRLQKWGVWEHLDAGKDLLWAIEESDEYSDYVLDRRLGCRQLGMNLCRRVIMRRIAEAYQGSNAAYRGHTIRCTYFEREYLRGIATDKLPYDRYSRPGYALKLARLLGEAAASSCIVGRSFEDGMHPLFDDGDEVVQEDESGTPYDILVADHSGAFGEYRQALENFAAHYARPVNSRARLVPDPAGFAQAYLDSFRDEFLRIQGDYRKRRRAFDNLFKHAKYDPAGSFAFRWEAVLKRLDGTSAESLVGALRAHLDVAR